MFKTCKKVVFLSKQNFKIMNTYKLRKDVANAKSFRFNGLKYDPKTIDQKTLKKLFNAGFPYVSESKKAAKKAVKNDETKKDNNGESN
jgi:hypothetical protein